MKIIDADRLRTRASDDLAAGGFAARPVLRRAAAAPARAVPPRARAPMSEGLRRAIRGHAQRDGVAGSAPRDADVGGLFGQAINAGIHELPSGAAGLAGLAGSAAGSAAGALGGLVRDPLAALGGLAGGALGGLGEVGQRLSGLLGNPAGALQGLLGGALGGGAGALGDLARDPLGALGGLREPGSTSPVPPPLAPLRAGLAPELQRELDQLAATPDGLAAIVAELRAEGSGSGGAAPAPGTSADAATGTVARHGAGEISADAGDVLARAADGPASALPDDLRARFASSLGADLSGVRVHADGVAARAAAALGAHALAHGRDIYFGSGQYRPGTAAGDHLIAHEVAHTVQQRGAPSGPQHQLEVSEPGDALEAAADRAADAMVAGAPASIA